MLAPKHEGKFVIENDFPFTTITNFLVSCIQVIILSTLIAVVIGTPPYQPNNGYSSYNYDVNYYVITLFHHTRRFLDNQISITRPLLTQLITMDTMSKILIPIVNLVMRKQGKGITPKGNIRFFYLMAADR